MSDISNAELKQKIQIEKVEGVRLPLIDQFYKRCKYKVKCGKHESIYALSWEGQFIAAARFLPLAANKAVENDTEVYLLRNLCVAPEFRQQGVARYLMQQAIIELAPQDIYCFALPHLHHFYETLGFVSFTTDQHENRPVVTNLAVDELHKRYRLRGRDWLLMGFIRSHII